MIRNLSARGRITFLLLAEQSCVGVLLELLDTMHLIFRIVLFPPKLTWFIILHVLKEILHLIWLILKLIAILTAEAIRFVIPWIILIFVLLVWAGMKLLDCEFYYDENARLDWVQEKKRSIVHMVAHKAGPSVAEISNNIIEFLIAFLQIRIRKRRENIDRALVLMAQPRQRVIRGFSRQSITRESSNNNQY